VANFFSGQSCVAKLLCELQLPVGACSSYFQNTSGEGRFGGGNKREMSRDEKTRHYLARCNGPLLDIVL